MTVHPWWDAFGETAADDTALPARASAVVQALRDGFPAARLSEVKICPTTKLAAVRFDVDVERPQDLAYPIARTEPVAVLVSDENLQPSVLALRSDFPADTPHQNEVPEGTPCAMCIDDRPWAEAKLTWTAADLIRRVQLWLAKAARGELHDAARPFDPVFFRSPISIIIPRTALDANPNGTELVGSMHEGGSVIVAHPLADLGGFVPEKGRLLVMTFRVGEQPMARLRQAPMTLARLAEEMNHCGMDLIKALQARTRELAGMTGPAVRKLQSRIAVVVAFPISNSEGPPVDDVRAFVTMQTAGEIGVALGTLSEAPSDAGGTKGSYLPLIGAAATSDLSALTIGPAELHFAIDRTLAAATAGKIPDARRAVLIGAGSLGSQLGLNLAREGCFSWTVVDNDHLLSHNIARHGLLPNSVGMPKATALAINIAEIVSETTTPIIADVTAPIESVRDSLSKALCDADVIIDATASVAAARYISELPASARRISVFFNPSGTSVVVLAEPSDRNISLTDLEAQYHRLIATDSRFADHLKVNQEALRYSGSCRALTNRIPATQAAILSALAANGLRDSLASDCGSIRIWTLAPNGEVSQVSQQVRTVTRKELASWTIVYDEGLLDALADMRDRHLPRETGGVLLGIADMSRRTIHLVAALPAPSDSVGSVDGFERGVYGLGDRVNAATEASLHQIRYVGEWHSHPRRASPLPSTTDIRQVMSLRSELTKEGLPAIMAIAADNGRFTFVIADTAPAENEATP